MVDVVLFFSMVLVVVGALTESALLVWLRVERARRNSGDWKELFKSARYVIGRDADLRKRSELMLISKIALVTVFVGLAGALGSAITKAIAD